MRLIRKIATTTIRTRMIPPSHFKMRLNIGLLTIEIRQQAVWIQDVCSTTIAQRFNAGFASPQPISPPRDESTSVVLPDSTVSSRSPSTEVLGYYSVQARHRQRRMRSILLIR